MVMLVMVETAEAVVELQPAKENISVIHIFEKRGELIKITPWLLKVGGKPVKTSWVY